MSTPFDDPPVIIGKLKYPMSAIDFIQGHILHQGDQSNETALEQMKDGQIAAAIRTSYRQVTGHELPLKEKK